MEGLIYTRLMTVDECDKKSPRMVSLTSGKSVGRSESCNERRSLDIPFKEMSFASLLERDPAGMGLF